MSEHRAGDAWGGLAVPVPLRDEHGAAAILAVTVSALRVWRRQGRGPPFVKVGRCVRYRPEDLRDFIQGNLRTSTAHKEG